jgi:hypothetical protein
MSDFLKKDVDTPLCGSYMAAGVCLRIATNSANVLEIANRNLEPWNSHRDRETVHLKLWVEDEQLDDCQRKPYYRGLGHLVYSGYSDRSSLVINLRDRCGAGRFTPKLAGDSRYWKSIVFPSLLGIVAPSVGLTSLHSACVAWRDKGLLLVGESGAGKSTLALALAQAGLDFLSDDRTFVSGDGGTLRAWASSREMKQRADAVGYFPALDQVECSRILGEDSVLRFDPAQCLGVSRVASCEPWWVVFLDRQSEASFSLEAISSREAAYRFERGLHQESPETTQRQRRTIDALTERKCYRLNYGGNPHTIAGALRNVVLGNEPPVADPPNRGTTSAKLTGPYSDPLRRFRATCVRSDTLIMGRHVRIETDSAAISRRIAECLLTPLPANHAHPDFVWRIVCEAGREPVSRWPMLTAFSDGPLRYISFGQTGFAAADLNAREAVAILPETLCEDVIGFSTVLLGSLLHLTAPALGLLPVSAACVSKAENGLLLFGAANSGKTTAAYYARKLGLEFHADQATFLDPEPGTLHAWGEFWPAAFRPESEKFLPDISLLGRPFEYGDRKFLCIDKQLLSGAHRARVRPAACIFLERRSGSPTRLARIPRRELAAQVFTEAGSRDDRNAILTLLQRVPSYRLSYDDDPSIAARLFLSVLEAHERMEQRI